MKKNMSKITANVYSMCTGNVCTLYFSNGDDSMLLTSYHTFVIHLLIQ